MNFFSNKVLVIFCFSFLTLFKGWASNLETKTPIQHLVIIYQENRSFDHYFGIYPKVTNTDSTEPRFIPRKNTPTINGLTSALRRLNQNSAKPFLLTLDVLSINSPLHFYTTLQQACDSGLMDKFVQTTGSVCIPPSVVMGYFDGNTVTALWNYAQFFSMSDNFRTTNIGASTVGAINLISGQVAGALPLNATLRSQPAIINGTIVNDIDPKFDECSETPITAELSGRNIGNLLNDAGVTWGWFHGGFADCLATHIGNEGLIVFDYIPHHNPFQYYASTSNPEHLPPTSPEMIGRTDQANHLYDIEDFWKAASIGNVPAVSFLKAPAYQNGHGGNSNPLLEQEFLVTTINRLQELPQWKNMAIIIAYDDSGGWYDHEMPTIINQSQTFADALTGLGQAGTNPPLGGFQGRPAYGFRVPFVLISPWAKENYVDHALTDQTSILRFIEDNWRLGRIGNASFDKYAGSLLNMFDFKRRCFGTRKLFLNPSTGEIAL